MNIQAIQLHICPTPFGTGRCQCVGRRLVLPREWIILAPLNFINRSYYESSPGNLLYQGNTLHSVWRVYGGCHVGYLECKPTGPLTPVPTSLFPSPHMRRKNQPPVTPYFITKHHFLHLLFIRICLHLFLLLLSTKTIIFLNLSNTYTP